GISIATYLNGAFVESFTANDPLVRVTLLSGSADVAFIGFPSTAAFNEVRISVGGLINASVLGDFIVYYAYVRADSDGDGVPDCLDKCCAGDDQLDGDGNGIPDACDGMPVAVNDTFELFVEDPVVLDVLANDDFGPDLPGTNAIRIVLLPENGVATVNDNGTPADPTDDFIDYLPAAGYQGVDSLRYLIEDSNGSTDTATVSIIIQLNTPPDAVDDSVIGQEDTPLVIAVLNNDTDPDGPDTLLTVVQGVVNGDLMLNADGTFTYTPDGDFNGLDSFRYSYCDNGVPSLCDTATVNISISPINDLPLAEDDMAITDEGVATNIPVLVNDNFGGDGPSGGEIIVTMPPANGDATVNNAGTPNDPTDDTVDYTPAVGFSGADSFEYQICDADGDCDSATVMVTVNQVCIIIEAFLFLEGALVNPQTGTYQTSMRTTLNDSRLLPGQFSENPFTGDIYTPPLGATGQVYNIAPWNYLGPEGNAYDSGGNAAMASANYPVGVVDWVLVSLRSNPLNVNESFCRQAALLFSDGHIELVNNSGCCNLDMSQSYYLVVEHRNHLLAMSHQAVAVANGVISYDFRDKQSYLNDPFGAGNLVGQKEVIPGFFALFAGNGDQSSLGTEDTDITVADFSKWFNNGPESQEYNLVDYNMDGDISSLDFELWLSNSPLNSTVPRD
ncbi:tandem-95 repeat protein, partial [Lewinella lacunae]